MRTRGKRGERGLTLVELIVAFTILAMRASMSVPLARYKVRRDQERELRFALHEIHKAIDDYKDAALTGKIETKLGSEGYPESLEQLVEGVKLLQSPDGKKIKFLRRIPKDPMTNNNEWGKRSMQDDPKSQSWGGQNVFDIYTKSFNTQDNTQYQAAMAFVAGGLAQCAPNVLSTSAFGLYPGMAQNQYLGFMNANPNFGPNSAGFNQWVTFGGGGFPH